MPQSTPNIVNRTDTFEAADGRKLFERRWFPSGDPKAVVAIVHGAAEHSQRYRHFAEFLQRNGYGTAAFDLRGHGRSAGRRLYVRSFDEYVDDVMIFLSRIRQRPIFLFGQSMGGAVVVLSALTRSPDVRGLILTGPFLEIGGDFSPFKVRAAKLLGRVLPRLPVDRLNPENLSRDEEVVEAYKSDPLVYHGWIPAATGAAGLRAVRQIKEREHTLELPVLVMHGTADQLADVEGSKRFTDTIRSDDKTLRLYEGFYHEVLNEPEKERVMEDVLQWLEGRV